MAFKIVAVCWLTFYVYWMAHFKAVKATAEPQRLATGLRHRLPLVTGAILMIEATRIPVLKEPLFSSSPITDSLGVVLCVLGLLFAIWARRTLARNWSSEVVFKQDHELVEQGPYHYVRHPIYTGLILMVLGTAIEEAWIGAFVGALCIALGFYIKLRLEEALMLRHFGAQYEGYKSRVKALVPYIL